MKLEHWTKAIALCSEIISLNSGAVKAWYRRGECYFLLEELKCALSDFEAVIKLVPDHENAIKSVALCKQGMKTVPNFPQEYVKKFGTGNKYHSVALGYAYKNLCQLSLQTLDQHVQMIQAELSKFETIKKRWGSNISAAAQAMDAGTLVPGQVLPSPKLQGGNYITKKFQTMKNYKIGLWMITTGETHVSIGCVDFAQLLYGHFEGDLTEQTHFHGIDTAMVSIVRCKVLYQMILNQASSRSILQVWFSSGWSDSTLQEFLKACHDILKQNELTKDEIKLVNHWLSNNIAIEVTPSKWFKCEISISNLDDLVVGPYEACANLKVF